MARKDMKKKNAIINDRGEDLKLKAINLLEDPELLKRIKEQLDVNIMGEDRLKLCTFLLFLSKDFDPQSIILTGGSAGGKNWVTNRVLDLFPNECVERITRFTPHGPEYHFANKRMDGKILFIQEYSGGQASEATIRPLISKDIDGLRVLTVGMNRKPQEIVTRGCPVLVSTTAEAEFDHQMTTRIWIGSIDESFNQTDKITKFEAEETMVLEPPKPRLMPIVKEAIRQLKKVRIIIPYALKLQEIFPKKNITARRNFKKFLTLIKCSAYLHQRQRPKILENLILATLEDLDVALLVGRNMLEQTITGLPEGCKKMFDYIRQEGFATYKEVAENTPIKIGSAYSYGRFLENEGYILIDRSEKTRKLVALSAGIVDNVLQMLDKEKAGFFTEKDFRMWLELMSYGLTDADTLPPIENTFTEIVRHYDIDLGLKSDPAQPKKAQNTLSDISKTKPMEEVLEERYENYRDFKKHIKKRR